MKLREMIDLSEWKELKRIALEHYRGYLVEALNASEIEQVWMARGATNALRNLLMSPLQGIRESELRAVFLETNEKDIRKAIEQVAEEGLKNES